tara:strand:+ start:1922 stop:2296 length:375 start_codon:yes stop_codon:yes gene_type:complete
MAYVYIANDLIYTHANTVTAQFECKDYGSAKGLTGSDLTTMNAKFDAYDTAMQPLIDAGTLVVESSPADSAVSYKKYTFTTDPVPAETWFEDIAENNADARAAMDEILDDSNVTLTTRSWVDRS